MRSLTLLGPQRLKPTLAATLDRLQIKGQVAAITAGWQEREAEVDVMREHLGRQIVDLRLHRRCQKLFAEEQNLFRAHRTRQRQLREMQNLYRFRLDFTIQPARELLRREGDADLLNIERKAAVAALRRLDEEHMARIAAVHRTFEQHLAKQRYPALDRHRGQIREILDDSSALVIAGGHVAVLLNRMRLCGLGESPQDLPIITWSAGAIALAQRIVLFHDSPPQGAGNAEILDQGLGFFDGLQPLPHARRRLRLDDPYRVQLLARRLAPALCIPLDEGTSISYIGGRWQPDTPTYRLTQSGSVERLEMA